MNFAYIIILFNPSTTVSSMFKQETVTNKLAFAWS